MTIEEKREILIEHCGEQDCRTCILMSEPNWTVPFSCGNRKHCLDIGFSPESDLDKALSLIGYVEPLNNPYWERITQMADRQRQKGIDTYGQGLEANTTPDALKRIEYIQEELIDALMYLEWLKEKLKGETNNGTEKET